jgi:hypothetical protein
VSSSLSNWNVEMNGDDFSSCSVSWVLLYRASISGFRAADFHRACDGMGKCVVVVKAENGRSFVFFIMGIMGNLTTGDRSPNLNGFIASVVENGGCGEIFHRNQDEEGILNHPGANPGAGSDLVISDDCHEYDSYSEMGTAYGRRGPGLNETALFGQEWFRVVDYEVFKIVIE